MVVAAILVGGYSRRFGVNKLAYPFRGRRLVEYVLLAVRKSRRVTSVVLVATPPTATLFEDLGVEIVLDYVCCGPLGAVYTLAKIFREFLVFPGDAPLLRVELVDYIADACTELRGYDACVLAWRERKVLEPLYGCYRSSVAKVLERALIDGDYSLQRAIARASLARIHVEDLPREWRVSLFNVNRFEDLESLSKLYAEYIESASLPKPIHDG